jgi:hypothetical protein
MSHQKTKTSKRPSLKQKWRRLLIYRRSHVCERVKKRERGWQFTRFHPAPSLLPLFSRSFGCFKTTTNNLPSTTRRTPAPLVSSTARATTHLHLHAHAHPLLLPALSPPKDSSLRSLHNQRNKIKNKITLVKGRGGGRRAKGETAPKRKVINDKRIVIRHTHTHAHQIESEEKRRSFFIHRRGSRWPAPLHTQTYGGNIYI